MADLNAKFFHLSGVLYTKLILLKIDYSVFINWIILSQLVLLPLLVLEWNPLLVVANRFLFYVAGIIAISYILTNKYDNNIFSAPYVFFIILFYMFYGFLGANNFHELFYESFLNGLMFLFGTALIIWSYTAKLINFPKFISILLVFHSIDVIFQALFGVNVVGLPPYINDRNWGMFFYGAPTSGVFISMVFFIPWFFLKGWLRVFLYILFIAALLLSNDRGPVIQVFTILLVYGMVYKFKLAITFVTLLLLIMLSMYGSILEYLPSRVGLLVRSFHHFIEYGINDFLAMVSENSFSIKAYQEKYLAIYYGWFNFSNISHVFFGSGIGITHTILEEYTGVGRPHHTILELLITFGVCVFAYFFVILTKVIKKFKSISVVIMPALFPFSFSTIYSFNWFILFLSACISMVYIYRKQLNNAVDFSSP